MYLTRLRLDPDSAPARRDLGDSYQMHKTLSRAFADDAQSSPQRFLWRLEVNALNGSRPVVLLQSDAAGRWDDLQSLNGYLSADPEQKDIDLGKLLAPARTFRFRLVANPTVTRVGKRFGLIGEQAQIGWLVRQGGKHGFAVTDAMVIGSEVSKGRKGGSSISLRTATFEGLLRVSDVNQLAQALVNGIGPGKALGCGLLSLAPS